MKKIVLGFALFLGMASTAHAIPSLFFSGTFEYQLVTDTLNVDGQLTFFEDTSLAPELDTSQFTLSASLTGVNATSNIVVGEFGSGTGLDFEISDGASGVLLSGELGSATMTGFTGTNFAGLSGIIEPDAGALLDDFDPVSTIIALEFNLTTLISADLFTEDFSGLIQGQIEALSISEPAVFWLMAGALPFLCRAWKFRTVSRLRLR